MAALECAGVVGRHGISMTRSTAAPGACFPPHPPWCLALITHLRQMRPALVHGNMSLPPFHRRGRRCPDTDPALSCPNSWARASQTRHSFQSELHHAQRPTLNISSASSWLLSFLDLLASKPLIRLPALLTARLLLHHHVLICLTTLLFAVLS